MTRTLIGVLALWAATLFVACNRAPTEAQPKVGEADGAAKKEAKKEPKKDEADKGKEKTELPPPVLPPFVREELDLTEEQDRQIAELEKEFHLKLMKILTEKQQKKLLTLVPKGPPGKDFPPPKDKVFKERPPK